MARWVARKSGVQHTARWRAVLCAFLIVLAAFVVVASIVVRYVDAKFLSTQSYVDTVSPLSVEPAVATALGTFTADRLFNNGAVENQVAEFLPARLAPAAPLLTSSLRDEVANVATNIAGSSAFQSTWITTNTAAHTALLAVAHSEPTNPSQPAELAVNLQGLFDKVRERFGGDDSIILNPGQKTAAADLAINVRQSAEQLRKTVGMIETGAWLLPLLAIALIVAAIFVANDRRVAVLAIGVIFAALGLLTLATLQITSNSLLASFEQEVYQNAARVIYESFYGDLRNRLIGFIIFGTLLAVVAALAGPYVWAIRARKWLHLPR